MPSTTEQLIANRFEQGVTNVDELLAPLAELAPESSSLIVGYVPTSSRRREDAIPYFHICGHSTEGAPVRGLLVGGWFGHESRSPYALARLIAAMEQRASLVEGLEVTAFPVANLAAHRSGTFLSENQSLSEACCWRDSTLEHVQILERELLRFSYDLVIHLREHPRAVTTDIEAWLTEEDHKQALGAAIRDLAEGHADLRWKINPSSPDYARTFTPIPQAPRQPSEIIIGLSGARSANEQTDDVAAISFALLHALRDERARAKVAAA